MNTLLYSVLLLCLSSFSLGNQECVIYDQFNHRGENIGIYKNYRPELRSFDWDDRAMSTCSSGVWLFFENENFNSDGVGAMEYVFGPKGYCINFQHVSGKVSSVKFAGAPDNHESDTLTLYEHDYFQGIEEYLLKDAESLKLKDSHRSIIITGITPWTVYDRTQHTGNAICLYPPKSDDYHPAFISDLEDVGIPRGSIRSIKKGCHSKSTITLKPFTSNQMYSRVSPSKNLRKSLSQSKKISQRKKDFSHLFKQQAKTLE